MKGVNYEQSLLSRLLWKHFHGGLLSDNIAPKCVIWVTLESRWLADHLWRLACNEELITIVWCVELEVRKIEGVLLRDTWVGLVHIRQRGRRLPHQPLFKNISQTRRWKKSQKVTSRVIYSACQIKWVKHLFCSSSTSSSSSWLTVSEDACWNPCSAVISESRLSHSSIPTSCHTALPFAFDQRYFFCPLDVLCPWFRRVALPVCVCHSKLRAIYLTQRGTEIEFSGERTEGCRDGKVAELGENLAESQG